MAFFKAGKVFELQKWTEDVSLNGKIVGIIDKKDSKQKYPCYIFETQKIINATAAQLTYPDLDSNSKQKLMDLLEEVIDQKKEYQLGLAERRDEEQKQKLLKKQQKAEQQKISAVIPDVVFDTTPTQQQQIIASSPSSKDEGSALTPKPQIVIQSPPKDLYQSENSDNLLIESEPESSIPKGYALVPVSTLNEVVKIKNQKDELEKKEIELIEKQNELSLAEKEKAIALKKKELEIERKQKEIEMDQKNLHSMESTLQKREQQNDTMQKQMHEQMINEREKRQRRRSEKQKRKSSKYADEDAEDERERKRKKRKKKKRRKKDEGCTTAKCCKCLIKKATIFLIIALIAGIVGLYFWMGPGEDENIYAFGAWAVAIIALVFSVCFWMKS